MFWHLKCAKDWWVVQLSVRLTRLKWGLKKIQKSIEDTMAFFIFETLAMNKFTNISNLKDVEIKMFVCR